MSEENALLREEIAALQTELTELKQERSRYLTDRAVIAAMSDSDNGKFDNDTFTRISGIPLHGNRFVLCGFTDHFSEPGALDEHPIWESLNSTFYYTLSDLICPQFQSQAACVTANSGGFIYCLVNLSDDLAPENYRSGFTRMCNQVNEAVYAAEGFRFQVLVSPIGYGMDMLPELRRNVDMLREYWEIVGDAVPEILFYSDAAHTSPEEKQAAASREANEQFSDYINRGDFDKAKVFFHDNIMKNLLNTLPSATMLRFRVAALLDYMTQTLTRASRELGIEQVLDDIGASELLLSAQTLDQIEAQMDVILDALAEQWKAAGTANQFLAQQARAYVDENYANRELNVNQVADHLGVSASHLTRVFQSCYQVRVLDYIQQVRIRAAKRLLSTGLTLREIAEQVGYGAQINMIRAFKRLEGKTPTEFGRDST